jgi:hypothetical protein
VVELLSESKSGVAAKALPIRAPSPTDHVLRQRAEVVIRELQSSGSKASLRVAIATRTLGENTAGKENTLLFG